MGLMGMSEDLERGVHGFKDGHGKMEKGVGVESSADIGYGRWGLN